MTPFTFLVISLAVWRFSYGVAQENGPLMLWARLRARLAASQKRSGGLFDMISCVRCLSFWTGLGAALFVSESILAVFGYAFAFSGASLLFNKLYSLKVVTPPTRND